MMWLGCVFYVFFIVPKKNNGETSGEKSQESVDPEIVAIRSVDSGHFFEDQLLTSNSGDVQKIAMDNINYEWLIMDNNG